MPTFVDLTDITPTSTNTWQDRDLSALVPVGTAGVIVLIHFPNAATGACGWRKKGSTDARVTNRSGISQSCVWVGVDANRTIQLYTHNTLRKFYLRGYYPSDEAVFLDNGIDVTPAGVDAWTDTDISATAGTDPALAALFEIAGTSANWGVRMNGSTDAVLSAATGQHTGAIVGLDANKVCEINVANTGTKFYLVGYIKRQAVFHLAAVNVKPVNGLVWEDLAPLPAGGTGGYYQAAGSAGVGFRANGSADDITASVQNHGFLACAADAGGVVEAYKSADTPTMVRVGYVGSSASNKLRALLGVGQ